MFEQDYIIRVIKEMVRAILKLIFHVDTDSPTADLLEETEEKELLEELLSLAAEGKIDQAENKLFELQDQGKKADLEVAILFYSYLNDQSDEFLNENDFSREEVLEGLNTWVSKYGIEGIAEVFLQ